MKPHEKAGHMTVADQITISTDFLPRGRRPHMNT
jgi:hypothetical protein